MRPPDLPPPEAFADRPHGTRVRYISGCRCAECRRANTQYELARAKARRRGEWNGLVNAAKARRRLFALSAAGVGRRSIAQFSGVSETTLVQIKSGRKTRIRAQTSRRILQCGPGAVADGGLVNATETHRRLAWLLSEGFTRTEIARRLGSKARRPSLQICADKVTRLTADRVERLYRQNYGVAA